MKLLVKILGTYKNLKLRTKLILSYVILIGIATFFTSSIYYDQSSRTILSNAEQNIFQIVETNNNIINLKLSQIMERSTTFVLDEQMYNIFDKVLPEDDYALVTTDRTIISILNKYFSEFQDISSSFIITKKYRFGVDNIAFYNKDNILKTRLYLDAINGQGITLWVPTYNVRDAYGINDIKDSSLLSSPYMFSMVKELNLTSMNYTNNTSNTRGPSFNITVLPQDKERPVLVINFDESKLRDLYKDTVNLKGTEYYIITKEGDVVSCLDPGMVSKKLSTVWINKVVDEKSGREIIEVNGQKMLICFDTMKVNGWISVAVIPVNSILNTLPQLWSYSLLMSLLVMLIACSLAIAISGWISKPIKNLISVTMKMRKGNFQNRIEETGDDEMGILIRSFNEMNEQIELLIEQKYKAEIREKEAQIMALNLQMNPHFLSNTLNIINWMAKANRQAEISKMILSLSTMLQYTMHNTRELVHFREEFEWLKGYVHIMSNRYTGMFIAEFDFPESFYNQRVPKLFLQPFIENAVIHGFQELDSGGLIKISGSMEGETRCFCIEDNGKGMPKEIIESAMNTDGSSIGIKNVDKRIKLLYGDVYGVTILSVMGKGTRVEVRMPVDTI